MKEKADISAHLFGSRQRVEKPLSSGRNRGLQFFGADSKTGHRCYVKYIDVNAKYYSSNNVVCVMKGIYCGCFCTSVAPMWRGGGGFCCSASTCKGVDTVRSRKRWS